jgi:hypothetical protein
MLAGMRTAFDPPFLKTFNSKTLPISAPLPERTATPVDV